MNNFGSSLEFMGFKNEYPTRNIQLMKEKQNT